jgi:SNF2 family DNA or RNA helicase
MPAVTKRRTTPNPKNRDKKTNKNKTKNAALKSPPALRVSPTRKPDDMTDTAWQTALRQQMAEKEFFTIKNLGREPVYSDFSVYSPASKNIYKVAMRSRDNNLNFCSCPDFKTNQLGTCKHIEFIRIQFGRRRAIKKLLEKVPEFPYSSLYVSYLGERKIKLRIGTDNKKKFEKWAGNYFDKQYTLLPDAWLHIERLLKEAHGIDSSFRCYEDALQMILAGRDQARLQSLVEQEGLVLVKDLVKAKLFPYQQEGILFATGAGRSVLADDMGLGKTVQAIAWAMLMQQKWRTQKVIIICPTSLKYQWKSEIQKFTDSSVTVIEGNYLKRMSQYENDENYFRIVSYHMAGNDWGNINKMRPDIVILDEAQRIKNWKAKISQNIKRIHSPYALVLTGTPLENNIEELYSLVQYIDLFRLGSLHHFLVKHQIRDEDTGKVTGYTGLNEIGRQLSGMLLRRRKKEVLKQLPGRMDKNLFVPMTSVQAELHEEYREAVARLVNKWRLFGFLSEQERQLLLNMLNMMRMVSDSTYILDQQTNHQTKLDELFNILDELLGMEGEKVVIFSQWERMTRLVAEGLKERKVKFEYLHGGIPGKNRKSLFTNFNQDPACKVFLSTDAGGVGLNLQAASNLINMDIPWNPAVLEQRIGRIHRMGQKKTISVTNLISQFSIEHRLLSLLQFKTAIAAGILDGGDDTIFMGEDRFTKFMKSVESITQEIPKEDSAFEVEEKAEIAKSPIEQEEFTLPVLAEEEPVQEESAPKTEIQHGAGSTNQTASDNGGSVANPNSDNSPASLVQNGIHFFTQLINTLQNAEGVKQLAATITERDEQTGRTWLKLLVDNEETVEKALNLLAGLFKGFGK